MLCGPAIVRWDDTSPSDEEDGRQIIFLTGRIDNRRELAGSIGIPASVPESDLILAAYRRHGAACAKLILGDFAFAILDTRERRIFAARDATGCQPVYYAANSRTFAVAERIEQLLSVSDVGKQLDEDFVAANVSNYFAHSQRTCFANIQKIPPGSSLTASADQRSIDVYWRPQDVPRAGKRDLDDAAEEFRELLGQAVRDRLPRTGRVGVHASGGLDCSSISVLAARQLRESRLPEPLAFSWHPPPPHKLDPDAQVEYDRIESVCAQEQLTPIYCAQGKDDVLEVLNRDHAVRPICNGTYGEWVVQKEAASRGVTTILSGFGGDEAASFNGRGYLPSLAVRGRWIRLCRFAKAQNRNPLRFLASHLLKGIEDFCLPDTVLKGIQNGGGRDVGRSRLMLQAIMRRAGMPADILMSKRQQEFAEETLHYINKSAERQITPLPALPPLRTSTVRRTQCQLLQWGHLSHRIESWAADGALHGIRYTYPLLDRRVVEFALGLPDEAFADPTTNRAFFRKAMEPFLPKSVCQARSKSDPARVTPLRNAVVEAFEEVGRRLKAGRINTQKKAYLDIPRLIRDLEPTALRRRTKLGRLSYAIEFLGVEETDDDHNNPSASPAAERQQAGCLS